MTSAAVGGGAMHHGGASSAVRHAHEAGPLGPSLSWRARQESRVRVPTQDSIDVTD